MQRRVAIASGDLDEIVHEIAVQTGGGRDQHVVSLAGASSLKTQEFRLPAVPVGPVPRIRKNGDEAAADRLAFRLRARSSRGIRSIDSRAPSLSRRPAASARSLSRATPQLPPVQVVTKFDPRPEARERERCRAAQLRRTGALGSQPRHHDRASVRVERVDFGQRARFKRVRQHVPSIVQDLEEPQKRRRIRRAEVADVG